MASRLPGEAQPICYRWECLSCEWFKRNPYGGVVLDGERQRAWWCVLIDERREPCKIRDSYSDRINPPKKRTPQPLPQIEQPQPSRNPPRSEILQPELSRPNIPSLSKASVAHLSKPEPVLPNLPNMEGSESWRSAQKRKRTE